MVKVVMTHEEILEACQAWLRDRGVPLGENAGFDFTYREGSYVAGKPRWKVSIEVDFETPHLTEGPYR